MDTIFPSAQPGFSLEPTTWNVRWEADAADRRAHLTTAAAHWDVLRVSADIVERARRPFPGEPIRTPDAIHLASALVARSASPGLEMLSLDDRIRTAARKLGFPVLPDA